MQLFFSLPETMLPYVTAINCYNEDSPTDNIVCIGSQFWLTALH